MPEHRLQATDTEGKGDGLVVACGLVYPVDLRTCQGAMEELITCRDIDVCSHSCGIEKLGEFFGLYHILTTAVPNICHQRLELCSIICEGGRA